jgi:hypothetical protein
LLSPGKTGEGEEHQNYEQSSRKYPAGLVEFHLAFSSVMKLSQGARTAQPYLVKKVVTFLLSQLFLRFVGSLRIQSNIHAQREAKTRQDIDCCKAFHFAMRKNDGKTVMAAEAARETNAGGFRLHRQARSALTQGLNRRIGNGNPRVPEILRSFASPTHRN